MKNKSAPHNVFLTKNFHQVSALSHPFSRIVQQETSFFELIAGRNSLCCALIKLSRSCRPYDFSATNNGFVTKATRAVSSPLRFLFSQGETAINATRKKSSMFLKNPPSQVEMCFAAFSRSCCTAVSFSCDTAFERSTWLTPGFVPDSNKREKFGRKNYILYWSSGFMLFL